MRNIHHNKKSGSHFGSERHLLKGKRAFEMPFSWLFAMIAGAFIIFIAIYTASRLITTEQSFGSTTAAKDISNLLNPITNGVTSAASQKPIQFTKETRLYFNCEKPGPRSINQIFGREIISFSEKSGFLSSWTKPGANISRYNKYVFSDNIEQGKIFYIYSKPFFAGFRVDDIIMMTAKDYCFVAPPQAIGEEIAMLGMKNINSSNSIQGCKKGSVSVCFGDSGSGCNISVIGECTAGIGECKTEYDFGRVEKNGETLYYFGNLMYGAIFSSSRIYECNVARLTSKIHELALIYKDKLEILKTRGCDSNNAQNFASLEEETKTIDSSQKFSQLYPRLKQMDKIACDEVVCPLYEPEWCL